METHRGLHPDFYCLVNKENGDNYQRRQSAFCDKRTTRHFFWLSLDSTLRVA
jgi:hypothetical protein